MRFGYTNYQLGYASQRNKGIYEKVKSKKLSVYKVEQIASFDRLIDIVHNVHALGRDRYKVRILPSVPKHWFPYVNFSLFGDERVMLARFHEKSPSTDPFISLVGKPFAEFFTRVWDTLWSTADEFSDSRKFETEVERIARRFSEGKGKVFQQIAAEAEERGELTETPPRY
jgi:hypothetical protein